MEEAVRVHKRRPMVATIAAGMFLVGCVSLETAQEAAPSGAARREAYATEPLDLPSSFAEDVYLPPIQKTGAGALLVACPNPDGLEGVSDLPAETVVSLINELWSGDTLSMQSATDPAMWPVLTQFGPRPEMVTLPWVDEIRPATDSQYSDSLAGQCYEKLLEVAWIASICPGPCDTAESASLKEDYFLLIRQGSALVWTVWP